MRRSVNENGRRSTAQRSYSSLHLFRWIKDGYATNCWGTEGLLFISNGSGFSLLRVSLLLLLLAWAVFFLLKLQMFSSPQISKPIFKAIFRRCFIRKIAFSSNRNRQTDGIVFEHMPFIFGDLLYSKALGCVCIGL